MNRRTPAFVLFAVLLLPVAAQGQPAAEHLKKGKAALDLYRSEKAIEHLNEAIRLDPSNPEAFLYRGTAYSYLPFMKKEAGADLTEAIRLNPKLVSAYVVRGRVHSLHSTREKAVDDFNTAIKLDPKNPEAFRERASHYANDGEYAKAASDYLRVTELAPDEPRGYTSLAHILATASDDKVRDGKSALKHATKAWDLTFRTSDGMTAEAVAASHAELGNFDEAVKWQKKAIELFSKHFEPLVEAGEKRLKAYQNKKPLRYETYQEWFK